MTEDQIERVVEALTDAADQLLLDGLLPQIDYDSYMSALSRWADDRLARVSKGSD